MGGGWQGASGDPRWLAADPRPALAPAPGMPTKEAIWVRKAAARCCPRAQPKCGGPRDWSPPPSSQECTALRRGSHLSRFTQLRTGVLTAEPGSASFHCQTFFLEVRPPSQGASCWEHSPPTPPPPEGVAQEGVQGRVRGPRSQRGGGATQGRVWLRPLSSLPPTMSRIPSPTPGFVLWAAASGRPLGYRTGESRPLCAIGGFPAGPCPGHRTGRGSGRVSGPCASRLEFSSRAASWTERAPDESA